MSGVLKYKFWNQAGRVRNTIIVSDCSRDVFKILNSLWTAPISLARTSKYTFPRSRLKAKQHLFRIRLSSPNQRIVKPMKCFRRDVQQFAFFYWKCVQRLRNFCYQILHFLQGKTNLKHIFETYDARWKEERWSFSSLSVGDHYQTNNTNLLLPSYMVEKRIAIGRAFLHLFLIYATVVVNEQILPIKSQLKNSFLGQMNNST